MNAGALLALSLAAAVIPTIAYVLLVWWIDRYEKEPLRLLAAAFLWGAAPAVLLAAILETTLRAPPGAVAERYSSLVGSAVTAPIVEEVVKGLALGALFLLAHAEFDDVLDGIVYGSIIGLGFGMAENALYFASALGVGNIWHWSWLVVARAIAFGLNHAMFTSFLGSALGAARNLPSRAARWLVVGLGLAASIVAHAAHNILAASDLCLVSLLVDWGGLLVIVAIVLLAWQRERRWIETYLLEEVRCGLLSPQEHGLLATRGRRYREFVRHLSSRGLGAARLWRSLASTAAELAFKKHQLAAMGEERHNGATVDALRDRLSVIRQRLAECQGEESA